MKKACNNALLAPGYVLSEENHLQLQKLRSQWLLLAEIAFASTLEEELAPLNISRSMLGQCFESAAAQLQAVLETTERYHEVEREIPAQH